MSQMLLYITANPKPMPESCSLQIGEAFLDAYSRDYPTDTIVRLPLCFMDVPALTAPLINVMHGKLSSALLDGASQRSYAVLSSLTEQFCLADRYVFVTPMWNLGYPPALKQYLDAVCVAGKTFAYTEQGAQGLLMGKKSLHIQAAGGLYSLPATRGLDAGAQHLQMLMAFLGVTDHTRLLAEGLDLPNSNAAQIVRAASMQARQWAHAFGQSPTPALCQSV